MLDHIVQFAKTEGKTEEQVIGAIQAKYNSYVQEGSMDSLLDFQRLKEATGVKPVLEESVVQDSYRENMGYGLHLRKLHETTGIKPTLPEEEVQAKYLESIKSSKGRMDSDFKTLMDLTGVKPELPEDVVTECYAALSKRESDLSDFGRLRELTGVQPSDEALLTYCRTALTAGQYEKAFKVMDEDGVRLTEEDNPLVQEIYSGSLKGRRALKTFKQLREKSGVEPSEEVQKAIQAKYSELAKKARGYEIKELSTNTGVAPVYNEADVQEGYKHASRNGHWFKMEHMMAFKEFFEVTGIKPSEELVQTMYDHHMTSGIVGGNQLRNRLGIEFSPENQALVQEKYLAAVENGNFDKISWLREQTGVEPSEEVKMRLTGKFMDAARSKDFSTFKELIEHSGLEIPVRASKIWVDFLFEGEKPSE